MEEHLKTNEPSKLWIIKVESVFNVDGEKTRCCKMLDMRRNRSRSHSCLSAVSVLINPHLQTIGPCSTANLHASICLPQFLPKAISYSDDTSTSFASICLANFLEIPQSKGFRSCTWKIYPRHSTLTEVHEHKFADKFNIVTPCFTIPPLQ